MDQIGNINHITLYKKNNVLCIFSIISTNSIIKNISYKNNILLENSDIKVINFLTDLFYKMKYTYTVFHYLDKIKNLSVFRNLKISDPENYSIGYN